MRSFCTMHLKLKLLQETEHGAKEGSTSTDLNLSLPVIKPNVEIPVIELIFKINRSYLIDRKAIPTSSGSPFFVVNGLG